MAHARVKTGVEGLDELLGGGLTKARIYLVQGDPGVGKTTLSMQFLLEGARAGESVLYVTLSETRSEIVAVRASHWWDLSGVHIYEMSSVETQSEVLDQENTLYTPDEVELNERMHSLLAEIKRVNPTRVVIDSCSELRLLARTPLRFRRQILALKAELVATRLRRPAAREPALRRGRRPVAEPRTWRAPHAAALPALWG